ncbi:MAG TPA: L-2-hydroxyglutarate oxidase [Acidimicrobiales bacterium]|nr:L-2-hydroxyglutarate oxidase [Acidimicrobiales bacterium]
MSDPDYDVAVVGAGLVGLATATRLLERRPGLRLVVIDKEDAVARHQSSHNSGVIHSGVYYAPGSLKARLCREGKAALELFASAHGIPVERCGKVIVAIDEAEVAPLDALHARAVANGVPGVEVLGPAGLRELEPHAAGVRALHVPGTAIIDFALVAAAYATDVSARGGELLLRRHVLSAIETPDRVVLSTPGGDITARAVITCAGLYSDGFGATTGHDAGPRIVPFRGDYCALVPSARHLVRGLIYPVPDPSLPFLGVHFTRRIDGEVWAGPNAVLAFAREGYRRSTVHPRELAATLRYPGFRRLARRYWRMGAGEMWRDVSKRAFLRGVQRYVPELQLADLVWGPSGVRAQAVAADGSMVDDFAIVRTPRAVHVRNAPSPAATASLAIGAEIAATAAEILEHLPG